MRMRLVCADSPVAVVSVFGVSSAWPVLQGGQEYLSVLVILKNSFAAVAARRDMVKRVGKLASTSSAICTDVPQTLLSAQRDTFSFRREITQLALKGVRNEIT